MEKEFLPYKESLTLKELGFDEPCLAHYMSHNGHLLIQFQETLQVKECYWLSNTKGNFGGWNDMLDYVAAPLYQQAFRWFREKYNYNAEIGYRNSHKDYNATLYPMFPNSHVHFCGKHKSYEEAELACIQQLISLCREKK